MRRDSNALLVFTFTSPKSIRTCMGCTGKMPGKPSNIWKLPWGKSGRESQDHKNCWTIWFCPGPISTPYWTVNMWRSCPAPTNMSLATQVQHFELASHLLNQPTFFDLLMFLFGRINKWIFFNGFTFVLNSPLLFVSSVFTGIQVSSLTVWVARCVCLA